MLSHLFRTISLRSCLLAAGSSAFLAFGLYNVHALSGVTEGGILGLTLLLQYWFGISPAVSGFLLNLLCFAIGWRMLGHEFLFYSACSSAGFSLAYAVFEQFDPLWPQLAQMPLFASVLGAVFVGLGCGVCVRAGGASGGDDALAMALSYRLNCKIEWIYLATDLSVLALSASYIPLRRLLCSLLTVVLSGRIVGLVQRAKLPRRAAAKK